MIGSLDSQVIEKFQEFQKKSGKYADLDIENVEFKQKTLDNLIDIFDSQRIPLSTTERNKRKGKYPYYGASGVIDYINDFIFDGEYLIISEDGENLRSRKTPIAYLASGKFWVNNHAHIVLGKEDILNTDYLRLFISSNKLNGFISNSSQPKLSQTNLKLISISIPKNYNEKYKSIDIQKAIVEFLEYSFDNLERIKSNIDKRYNIVTKMKKSLIPSTFKRTAIKNKFRKYAQKNNIKFDITDITFNDENTFGSIFEFNGGSSKYTKPYYTNPKNKGDYPLFTGSTNIVEFIKPINQNDINDAPAISYNKDNDKGSLAFYHTEPFIVGGHHYALELKNEFLKNIDLKYSYYSLSEHFSKNMYYQSKEPRANSGVIKDVKFLIPEPLQGFSSIKIQQILVDFIESVENELETKFLNPINKCLGVIEKYKETYLKRTFLSMNWSK